MTTNKMSALRLTAGAAALAVAAVGSVMVPGGAADAASTSSVAGSTAHRGATSISIRVAKAKIQPGKTDTVAGNLQIAGVKDKSGRQVTLEAKSTGDSDFTPVGVATAGTKGGIALTVAPEITTKYRWHYFGSANSNSRVSAVATVKVGESSGQQPQRLGTSLSIRAIKARVDVNGVDTIRGTLRSRNTALPNKYVVLLSHPAGKSSPWEFVDAERTNKDGRVSLVVRPKVATAYQLRFLGTKVFRPSRSAVARVGIRPSVSITANPVSLDPGESTAITGVVTKDGAALSGATVNLLAKATGTKKSFAVVGTATSSTEGTVSLVARPTRDTTYRLQLVKSAGTPAALSPAVRVQVRYPSSLSIRGRDAAAGKFVVSGVLRGHSQVVRGVLVSLVAKAPSATDFTPVASARTDKSGKVAFTEAGAPGTTYQLVFGGNKRFAGSSSGTVVD